MNTAPGIEELQATIHRLRAEIHALAPTPPEREVLKWIVDQVRDRPSINRGAALDLLQRLLAARPVR